MVERMFLSVLSTSLATSLIIILLMILSPFINRRYAAKWKYWVWIILALRLIVPFHLTDVQNMIDNLSQRLTAEALYSERDAVQTPQNNVTVRPNQRILLELPSGMTEPLAQTDRAANRVTKLIILECIWIAGSMIFLGIHLGTYMMYKRQVLHGGILRKDKAIAELLHSLSDELQLKKRISIIEYSKAASPMMLGFVRPVLILPAEEYSDEELFFILKHELIHYKRHDVWCKLLFVLANAIHWFNPFIWLMQREAVVDMELSCDERVMLDAGYTTRKAYTETLFSTLHKKCTSKTPLSTQFYGGKRVMEKRFRNILGRSGKRSGFIILLCTFVLVISLGLLIGCSVPVSGSSTSVSEEESTKISERIVAENVDVPEIVLDHAKELVAEWFVWAQTEFPDYGYANWRIELLTHCYTYKDFEGITLQIYQLNYELLSEQPENVMLAGGMSITEDGWVTPDYSNSRFLIFQQNGDDLTYLTYLFENDCYPPDEVFTDDLRNQLESTDILGETDTSESGNTTTLTYIMEGEPVEQVATLFKGSGYSIYVPDDDWVPYGSDIWHSIYNDRIRFWVTCYADQDISQVKRELGNSQGMLPDVESIRENEMTGQIGDLITKVRLIEQPEASHVWAVFYCYPEGAIEGAGARLPVIVDTFSAAETVKNDFWNMIPSSGETNANVLQFTNGLRLILPEAWNDKIVLEKNDLINTLYISEKNNANADGGGELVHLFYIGHNEEDLTFSADNPYRFFGEDARNIHKVLGVYRTEDNEYALIYTRYSDADYTNEDPKLRKDFQDLYKYVDEVQVITDNMPGFTECGLEDLDWIWME